MTFGSRVTIHARPTAHLNKYPIASNKSYPSATAKGGVAFKYLQYTCMPLVQRHLSGKGLLRFLSVACNSPETQSCSGPDVMAADSSIDSQMHASKCTLRMGIEYCM